MPSTPIRRYRHVPYALRMQRRREVRREKILQKHKKEIKSIRITEECLRLKMDQLNTRLEQVEELKRALEDYQQRQEQQEEHQEDVKHEFCSYYVEQNQVEAQAPPAVEEYNQAQEQDIDGNANVVLVGENPDRLPMRVILPTDRLGDLGRSHNVAVYDSNMTMCIGTYPMLNFLNAIALNGGYEPFQKNISPEENITLQNPFFGILRPPRPVYQDDLMEERYEDDQAVLGQQWADESDEEEAPEDDEPADDEVPEDPVDPADNADQDYDGPADYERDPAFQQAVNAAVTEMVRGVCEQIADALNVGLHNQPNQMLRIDVPGGGQFLMFPKIIAPMDQGNFLAAREEVVEQQVREDGVTPLDQALYPGFDVYGNLRTFF